MVISKIISLSEGKALIYADAENREKFISVLAKTGVRSVVTPDTETGGVNAELRPADVKKIAPILDKKEIMVYIKDVCGFAGFCAANRKRVGVLLGIIIFFAMLLVSTLYVMRIEVSGSNLLSKQTVIDDLEQFGISVGTKISEIDKDTCADRFLAKYPEFSWVAINFEGTTASITLKEKEPQQSQTGEKYDYLTADRDGVIKSLLVYSGKAAVKPGSAVKRGDILITGYITGSGLQFEETPSLRYEGAMGSVIAEVKENVSVFVPYHEETVSAVNTERVALVISVIGKEFVLGKIPESGVTETPEKYIEVFGAVELPVTCREIYTVGETVTVTERDVAQARTEAEKQIYKAVSESLGEAEITALKVTMTEEKDGIRAEAEYTCLCEIAIPGYVKQRE